MSRKNISLGVGLVLSLGNTKGLPRGGVLYLGGDIGDVNDFELGLIWFEHKGLPLFFHKCFTGDLV